MFAAIFGQLTLAFATSTNAANAKTTITPQSVLISLALSIASRSLGIFPSPWPTAPHFRLSSVKALPPGFVRGSFICREIFTKGNMKPSKITLNYAKCVFFAEGMRPRFENTNIQALLFCEFDQSEQIFDAWIKKTEGGINIGSGNGKTLEEAIESAKTDAEYVLYDESYRGIMRDYALRSENDPATIRRMNSIA